MDEIQVNVLLAALEQQRNEAMNKLAHANAQITMLNIEIQDLKKDEDKTK